MVRIGRERIGMRTTTRLSFALFVGVLASIAAYGLLSILRPAQPAPLIAVHSVVTQPAPVSTGVSLRPRIDALRTGLAATEAQIDQLQLSTLTAPAPAALLSSQDPAPSLALQSATERRDISLRQAKSIRDAIAASRPVIALAGVRESAAVGQLLGALGAVNDEIAKQSALLRPTHPTMLALLARKTALDEQIKAAAADVATALESDAKAEDLTITSLSSEASSPIAAAAPTPASSINTGVAADLRRLQLAAASQRAELDTLLSTDTSIPITPQAPTVTTTTVPVTPTASEFPVTNLWIAIGAGLVALFAQMLMTRRRRMTWQPGSDLAAWREDERAEPAHVAETQLRHAS